MSEPKPDPDRFVAEEHVPLMRRALAASTDPCLVELGKDGRIKYLVVDDVTELTVEIYDVLIEPLSSENRPPNAEVPLQKLRDAIQPYVGKQLLRAGIALPGREYEIHVDPVTETVLHFYVFAMGFDWPDSIEEEPAYHQWLESVLFREEFFDETIFEASQTLYEVQLHRSLLEDAIYRGIEPARFQKADLNAAVRDASSEFYGHHETKWFHVNVHDNLAREVEQFGKYSFDFPLEPIYNMLEHHQAMEGGTTYAGLASAHREWVLLFEDVLHISVHGERRFVERVVESLE